MSSYRQIEANRRNALRSTGPKTEAGKSVSRCNAVRHGLTAETVISALEDAEDYKAFEASITADYDAQSAIERELVLRLPSILWRLRRAVTMETGLFEIQAEHLHDYQQKWHLPTLSAVVDAAREQADVNGYSSLSAHGGPEVRSKRSIVNLAHCFLRLANLPNLALDRLSRYETALWHQARQILFVLDALDRRKPQERAGRFRYGEDAEL
jgi:hypothetical protein